MKSIKIPETLYSPDQGDYGRFFNHRKKNIDWQSCREIFHTHYSGSNFLFACHDGDIKKVVSFIRHADKILKLKLKLRCKFAETNQKGILLVRPGPFWSSICRSELLTILLRASKYYYKSNDRGFWAACIEEPYLKETWDSFVRFMKGYTNIRRLDIKEPFYGWCDEFNGVSSSNLKKMLVVGNKKNFIKGKI